MKLHQIRVSTDLAKRMFLTVLSIAVCLGSSCPPQSGGNSNTPKPQPWDQVYGNKENTGFNPVDTQLALHDSLKWTAFVGALSFSSPVIGPDGTIWVGNNAGEIVGINPDGSEHRRRMLDQSIVSSPAVNSVTNEIFVVGEHTVDSTTQAYASLIYRLDAGAGLLQVSRAPLATGASPKLWNNFLFLSTTGGLSVFDQTTLNRVGTVDGLACFNLVCATSGLTDVLEELVSCLIQAFIPSHCRNYEVEPGVPADFGPVQEPTVAIVDSPSVVDDPNKPIIVTLSSTCANGFRFFPDGDAPAVAPPTDRHFQLLWSKALVEVDCDFKSVRSTTPIVTPFGQVVFGDENGRVTALDPNTGNQIWQSNVGEPVQGPPIVDRFGLVYILTTGHLITLDVNGNPVSSQPLNGTGQAAAFSNNFAYVTSTAGMNMFDLPNELTPAFDATIGSTIPSTYGKAIPAVSDDGTVYVSSPGGTLFAFSSHLSISHDIVLPTVGWETPADGATILSAPGQTLTVHAAGQSADAFDGTVSFSSNINGMLCANAAPSDGTATCITTTALSIGTHTLTAFATDPSGGTHSAAITVQVANTPPSVAITSPADNANIANGTSIAFTAQITDPDQSTFAADKIQWQSSIDGNIGTGASFSKVLSPGAHTITITVTDISAAIASATITIKVVAGPTVTILTPTADSVFELGTSINFGAQVTDALQASFPADHLQWRSNIDGDIGTGLAIAKVLTRGSHTVTLTATNNEGVAGSASVNIVVNARPAVTIQTPVEGAQLFSGSPITFSATVTDADEPAFPSSGVQWTSNLDGILGTGASVMHALTNGNHTITVTATDAHGLTAQASVHVSVSSPIQ